MIIIMIKIKIIIIIKHLYGAKTMHISKNYKRVLNTLLKRNILSRFLKVARLLQNLIGNGNEFRKTGVAWTKAGPLSYKKNV